MRVEAKEIGNLWESEGGWDRSSTRKRRSRRPPNPYFYCSRLPYPHIIYFHTRLIYWFNWTDWSCSLTRIYSDWREFPMDPEKWWGHFWDKAECAGLKLLELLLQVAVPVVRGVFCFNDECLTFLQIWCFGLVLLNWCWFLICAYVQLLQLHMCTFYADGWNTLSAYFSLMVT